MTYQKHTDQQTEGTTTKLAFTEQGENAQVPFNLPTSKYERDRTEHVSDGQFHCQ